MVSRNIVKLRVCTISKLFAQERCCSPLGPQRLGRWAFSMLGVGAFAHATVMLLRSDCLIHVCGQIKRTRCIADLLGLRVERVMYRIAPFHLICARTIRIGKR